MSLPHEADRFFFPLNFMPCQDPISSFPDTPLRWMGVGEGRLCHWMNSSGLQGYTDMDGQLASV